ncbi:MAG: hypothetical protein AB8G18_07785 [Gammaproteobacteria bacterium]
MSSPDHDHLSRHLLRELSSLNYRFIQLLINTQNDPEYFGLTELLHQRLCQLSESDQRRLASCPYGLFELRLNEPATWENWLEEKPASADLPSSAQQFTLAVLMYTQQLSLENNDLGRLLLGLVPRVAEQFRQASIGRLMDTAPLVSHNLRIRLIDDPNFWPDLVNYVRDGTQEQYVAAQTSALQILAAQL